MKDCDGQAKPYIFGTNKNRPMEKYHQIFENNRRWVADKLNQNKDFFKELSKGQNPEFLYIGCSDSRVPANEIMGIGPGEVFVHRNIANLVGHTDLNAQSVIEYAVVHLKVKHVIVCGHYGCGGVNAAMQPKDFGILNGWLRNIRDVYRYNVDELEAITDDKARFNRLVELNVHEQVIHLLKIASIQKRYYEEGYPHVHGWVYSLEDGLLKDLKVDMDAHLAEIRRIYAIV